jgi:tRNA (guanine37-N1)-methyltransferase
MHYTIFTLQPNIFDSFLSTSLISKGIESQVITVSRVNWRDQYGIGGYKQIDDKPFGGGHGMVLQPGPIYNALVQHNLISELFSVPKEKSEHKKILPNNSDFFKLWKQNPAKKRKVTIPMNQQIAEWLSSNFDEIGILCGRYEGFDHRVSEIVDLELSLGNYVLNGGEVAAMAIIESTARLVPGFVTKSENVLHDSFSSGLNYYNENEEFVVGKNNLAHKKIEPIIVETKNLFDEGVWKQNILPFIEHPQYTRPEIWENLTVPDILLGGNHKIIQKWRSQWWVI